MHRQTAHGASGTLTASKRGQDKRGRRSSAAIPHGQLNVVCLCY